MFVKLKQCVLVKDVTICHQPDVVCLVSSPQGPMGPRGPPGPSGSPVSTSCVSQTAHKPGAPADNILRSAADSVLGFKSHNCNVLDLMCTCAASSTSSSTSVFNNNNDPQKWPVTSAIAQSWQRSVFTRSAVWTPEEGGTQRILLSLSCRLRGFFLWHNPDILQNTCQFTVHRAYELTPPQTHTPSLFCSCQQPGSACSPFSPPSWVKLLSCRQCQPTCLNLMVLLTMSPHSERRIFPLDTFYCFKSQTE